MFPQFLYDGNIGRYKVTCWEGLEYASVNFSDVRKKKELYIPNCSI